MGHPQKDFLPFGRAVTTERIVDHADGFHIVKQMDCEPIIKAIKAVPEISKRVPTSRKYLGSVPNLVAVIWAKEWGVRPFSKEWNERAAKRLKHDPNWIKLRVRS